MPNPSASLPASLPTQALPTLRDVPAPAKLNLFLHITGRRADGYHLLQSVFMLIDWCDTLHFALRPDGAITRHDLSAPLPAEDLIVRAARLLQQHTGCALGADIQIDKRIPAQAGLGGGSSDAASTLLALNRLWGLGLPRARLAALGLQLGADVPFFVGGRNAWVEGVGEQLTPLALPPAAFAVVKPDAGLNTADIFRHPALRRETKAATISGFVADPTKALGGFGHNDLQPVAEQLCPPVRQALDWLAAQGWQGRMTGSGSAVFAPVPSGAVLPPAPAGMQVRICNNMEVHPLWGWAASDS